MPSFLRFFTIASLCLSGLVQADASAPCLTTYLGGDRLLLSDHKVTLVAEPVEAQHIGALKTISDRSCDEDAAAVQAIIVLAGYSDEALIDEVIRRLTTTPDAILFAPYPVISSVSAELGTDPTNSRLVESPSGRLDAALNPSITGDRQTLLPVRAGSRSALITRLGENGADLYVAR